MDKSVQQETSLLKKTKSKAQVLVVVSDLHCGSDVGLLPETATLHSGNTVGFGENYAQRWLWESWTAAQQKVREIAGTSPYVLLVNGDATEGIHHHNADVVASKIEDHTQMAVDCLRGLSARADRTLVTQGTECHTKGMEDVLADKLGAEGDLAKSKWIFRMHGVLCDATHHVGVTSRKYLEAGLLSIAIANAREQSSRAGHQAARVFLRAHRHCGGHYSDGESLICVSGGWQFLTRHGYKVVPDAVPRPSIMILDWRGLPEGSLPAVHPIMFNPPQPVILDL